MSAITRTTRKLAPCPFCGCRKLRIRHLSDSVHVVCTRCAACGPPADIDWADDPTEGKAETAAVEAWGARGSGPCG